MLFYLSLGSNLGDRLNNLKEAAAFLETRGEIKKISPIFETSPVGIRQTGNFFNLVLELESPLQPNQLLFEIKAFEKKMGRDLDDSHNKPRTIDIDILLADNTVIAEPDLIIPHPAMNQRAFVLVPLCGIAPNLVHPLERKTISELLKNLQSSETVRKLAVNTQPDLWLSDE